MKIGVWQGNQSKERSLRPKLENLSCEAYPTKDRSKSKKKVHTASSSWRKRKNMSVSTNDMWSGANDRGKQFRKFNSKAGIGGGTDLDMYGKEKNWATEPAR